MSKLPDVEFPPELARYRRQLLLPELGVAGQRRLGGATVLVVGCGALGSAQLQLLCRAGVGRLRFADPDRVALDNLHRQLLFDEADARRGRPKVEAAAEHLAAMNSTVVLEALRLRVGADNITDLLQGVDLVLDASDDLHLRFVVNDACVRNGVPWIYGGVEGSGGMVLEVEPGAGPCLRCLFPEPAPGTGPPPVFGPAPVVVGSLQAALALRRLAGARSRPGRLLLVDTWAASWRQVEVAADPLCDCCAQRHFSYLAEGL